MGFLNHLFESTESTAKEIEADEESIAKHWKQYLETIPPKKKIITEITNSEDSEFQNKLKRLKRLLELELIEISHEEREESELISDLKTIEHSKKIKRVQKLEQCLGYAKTKYEHVYRLLEHIYQILTDERNIIRTLEKTSKNYNLLISHLKSQLEIELEVLSQTQQIKTFHTLFLTLVRGEHIIRRMDSKEKRLLKTMQTKVSQIFSGEINDGITYEWAIAVFDAIEDKVHEGVANGMFPGYHPDIDFEFVNRPEFIDLVKEKIKNLKGKEVSEQMIHVFVYLFREWFNYERD
ncbi:MAG: hypothetical protein WC254_02310 [Candidatus Woesearchaeota archaeon]|jgi:hypothetical protein